MVAVDDVVGAHVLQMDSLLFEELQRLVHILQTVDTHPAFCGLWLKTIKKGGQILKRRREDYQCVAPKLVRMLTSRSPDSTSSSLMSMRPSRRSR